MRNNTTTTNPLAVFVAAIGKIGGYKAVERQLAELRRHIASMTPEVRHDIMRVASPVLGAPVSTDEIRELFVSSPEQGFFELERLGAAPEGAADVGRIVTDAIRDERLAPETRATLLWRYNHMAEYRDSALAGVKGVIPFGLLDSEEGRKQFCELGQPGCETVRCSSPIFFKRIREISSSDWENGLVAVPAIVKAAIDNESPSELMIALGLVGGKVDARLLNRLLHLRKMTLLNWLMENDETAGEWLDTRRMLFFACANWDLGSLSECVEAAERKTPGIVASCADGQGRNLLWYTLYNIRGLGGKTGYKDNREAAEDMLVTYGADPDAPTAWGVSWRQMKSVRESEEWAELSGWDWVSLLKERPQFADKCDWTKLDGWNWEWLLVAQPQFADKCNKWDEMSGGNWSSLLEERPQFADKCDWSKLSGNDWRSLLRKQPQFADKCDWSKLEGGDWASLLRRQPQFADKCDWSKLDDGDWTSLFKVQRHCLDRLDWSKLSGRDCSSLLRGRPSLADRCDWTKLSGRDWASLLLRRPQFARKCDKWAEISGWNWSILLRVQPTFADKCDKWAEMRGRGLASLLIERSQFADKCDWSKLDGGDWAELLQYRPQFADKCDWSKLDGGDWYQLLTYHLQFADRCDWSKLDGGNWCLLLQTSSGRRLIHKCDWAKLNGGDWDLLLTYNPQFADKCDWSKLSGEQWAHLLGRQPQFADKCDCAKLSGEQLFQLLKHLHYAAKRGR